MTDLRDKVDELMFRYDLDERLPGGLYRDVARDIKTALVEAERAGYERAIKAIDPTIEQVKRGSMALALEEAAQFVFSFREIKDWRKGRVLVNGRHDRDDVMVSMLREMAQKVRDGR